MSGVSDTRTPVPSQLRSATDPSPGGRDGDPGPVSMSDLQPAATPPARRRPTKNAGAALRPSPDGCTSWPGSCSPRCCWSCV